MCTSKEFKKQVKCPERQAMAERVGVNVQDFVRAATGYQIGRQEWLDLKNTITRRASRLGTDTARRYSALVA